MTSFDELSRLTEESNSPVPPSNHGPLVLVVKDSMVTATRQVDAASAMILQATHVTKERTGIHARIEIRINETVLGWSILNIERDEDRLRLSNKCYGMLGPVLKALVNKDGLKHDFDNFASKVWDKLLGSHLATRVPGDLEPAAKPLLVPFILEGGGTILFAAPGSGKSFIGQGMCVAVDAGLDEPWSTRQANSLFVNLERSAASVRSRLGAINQALGLPVERPLLMYNARGHSLVDVREAVERTILEEKVGLVVVDSISRAGAGSLVKDDVGNAICDILNGWGIAWLAIAHSPRGDNTHEFGTIMFSAAADLLVQQTSETKAVDGGSWLGVGLQIVKANDTAKASQVRFALEFDQRGLFCIRRADAGEFADIEAEGSTHLSRSLQIRDYLTSMGATTADTIASDLGMHRSSVVRILTKGEDFVRAGDRGGGKNNPTLWGLRHPER